MLTGLRPDLYTNVHQDYVVVYLVTRLVILSWDLRVRGRSGSRPLTSNLLWGSMKLDDEVLTLDRTPSLRTVKVEYVGRTQPDRRRTEVETWERGRVRRRCLSVRMRGSTATTLHGEWNPDLRERRIRGPPRPPCGGSAIVQCPLRPSVLLTYQILKRDPLAT